MKQNRESRQNVEVELISYSLFIQTSCEHEAATETLGLMAGDLLGKIPFPLHLLWICCGAEKKTI